MKVIIETEEQYKTMLLEIANAINANISFSNDDLFDDLPNHVKEGILESREQIKNDDCSSHDAIMKKYISKYQ